MGSTSRLNFKWSVELVESVRARAEADGVSVNAWVGRAVEEALDRLQAGAAPSDRRVGSRTSADVASAVASAAPPRPSEPVPEIVAITAAQDERNVAVTRELVDRERPLRRCPVAGCDFKASTPSESMRCPSHQRLLLDFGL